MTITGALGCGRGIAGFLCNIAVVLVGVQVQQSRRTAAYCQYVFDCLDFFRLLWIWLTEHKEALVKEIKQYQDITR